MIDKKSHLSFNPALHGIGPQVTTARGILYASGPAPRRSRWRHTRKIFQAIFSYGRGYEVITDGQLETYATNAIEAIVECKSKTRTGERVDMPGGRSNSGMDKAT